jgi:hypothetical protein
MWIRDELPKLHGTRAILYGYDTRLKGSSSFQRITDLAKRLIDQLHAARDPSSQTPLIFLAHSLGGLVVKQALRDLTENYTGKAYQDLLHAVRGAIFFGVPNLGMEQKALQAIVRGNPNEELISELSANESFVRELSKAFASLPLHQHCTFRWAYEMEESPTAVVCDHTANPIPKCIHWGLINCDRKEMANLR